MRHLYGKAVCACLVFLGCLLVWYIPRHAAEKPYTNSIGMEFVLIPAGSVAWETDNDRVITATISTPYYLGMYEVTQKQWQEVMGDNPAKFKGRNNPVECVSWHDVQEFIRRLNEKEGHDRYRLPTEAEWEHAARAGTTTEYFFGDSEENLGQYAWHWGNSDMKTHPVGQKKPNPWGLYDIYGNVEEWVQDGFGFYPETNVKDYRGPSGVEWGEPRVFRGGSWYHPETYYWSAGRSFTGPDNRDSVVGFRLALSPAG